MAAIKEPESKKKKDNSSVATNAYMATAHFVKKGYESELKGNAEQSTAESGSDPSPAMTGTNDGYAEDRSNPRASSPSGYTTDTDSYQIPSRAAVKEDIQEHTSAMSSPLDENEYQTGTHEWGERVYEDTPFEVKEKDIGLKGENQETRTGQDIFPTREESINNTQGKTDIFSNAHTDIFPTEHTASDIFPTTSDDIGSPFDSAQKVDPKKKDSYQHTSYDSDPGVASEEEPTIDVSETDVQITESEDVSAEAPFNKEETPEAMVEEPIKEQSGSDLKTESYHDETLSDYTTVSEVKGNQEQTTFATEATTDAVVTQNSEITVDEMVQDFSHLPGIESAENIDLAENSSKITEKRIENTADIKRPDGTIKKTGKKDGVPLEGNIKSSSRSETLPPTTGTKEDISRITQSSEAMQAVGTAMHVAGIVQSFASVIASDGEKQPEKTIEEVGRNAGNEALHQAQKSANKKNKPQQTSKDLKSAKETGLKKSKVKKEKELKNSRLDLKGKKKPDPSLDFFRGTGKKAAAKGAETTGNAVAGGTATGGGTAAGGTTGGAATGGGTFAIGSTAITVALIVIAVILVLSLITELASLATRQVDEEKKRTQFASEEQDERQSFYAAIYNCFMNMGGDWTEEQRTNAINSIMVNAFAESNIRANNLEDIWESQYGTNDESYTELVNRGHDSGAMGTISKADFIDGVYVNSFGMKNVTGKNQSGYGYLQFTSADKRESLYNFAEKYAEDYGKDFDIGDPDMQALYVASLLEDGGDYHDIAIKMLEAGSPTEATSIWLKEYEKPAGNYDYIVKNRMEYLEPLLGTVHPPATINMANKKIVKSRGIAGVLGTAISQYNIAQDGAPGTSGRRVIYNGYSDNAWCAAFVVWVFNESGNGDLYCGGSTSWGCSTAQNWGFSNGRNVYSNYYGTVRGSKYAGKPGDLVLFYNESEKYTPDGPYYSHIGIILENNGDGTYKTIEGNTGSVNQSNGNTIGIKQRTTSDYSSFYIYQIIRPYYPGSSMP